MPRLVPAFEQFFDGSGDPLVDGLLDFYESGSSSVRKKTYADSGETILNANPVVLGADGRAPDIFGTGNFRAILRTSAGVQVLQRDPVGGDQVSQFGADWVSTQTYSETEVVRDAGRYWESQANNNLGNRPSTDDGTNWTEAIFSATANIALSGVVFDLISDLRSNVLASGTLATIKGHTSINDGGEGGFVYTTGAAPGTYVDNNGTIIVPTGGDGSSAWLRIYSGSINGKWFGMAGDGVTDDSDAFIAAVNASDGGALFLPSNNTYLLNDINTVDNQTPTFTASLNLYSDDRETCIVRGSTDMTQNLRLKQVSDYLIFRNITFSHWESCAYMPASAGDTGYDMGDVFIDNCRFTDISQAAIVLAHNGEIKSFRVTNSIFEDITGAAGNSITSGLWVGSEVLASQELQENFIVSGNVFRNITCADNDADCHGLIFWGESMVISGNTFEDIHNNNYGIGSEGIYTKAKFCIVSDNVLKNAGYVESAINLKGTYRGASVGIRGYSNIISNNVITWDSTDTNDKRGIYARTDDLLITGNIIDGCDYGIWSGTEALNNRTIVITNNVIRNLRSFDGISIANYSEKLTIRDNIIESVTYDGATLVKLIYVENTSGVINRAEIIGNTVIVDDRCTATGDIRCISVNATDTIDQITIRDNNILFTNLTATPYAIRLAGEANISRVDIFDNSIPSLGDTDILDFKQWLYLTVIPTEYNFRNNGNGIEGSNIYEEKTKYTKTLSYDHSIDPSGTVLIGELPTGAVITNAVLSCNETFAPAAGTTTIAIGITTDDVSGIFPVTQTTNAAFTNGTLTQAIPDNTVANFTNITTGIRTIRFVITGTALTAGNMEITLEYIMP